MTLIVITINNEFIKIYLTFIRSHLEYACQLWDPYTVKGIDSLEAVQCFACRVCLKTWNITYDDMLHKLISLGCHHGDNI